MKRLIAHAWVDLHGRDRCRKMLDRVFTARNGVAHLGLFREALGIDLSRRVKSELLEQRKEYGRDRQISDSILDSLVERQCSVVVRSWKNLDPEVLQETDRFVFESSNWLIHLCQKNAVKLGAPDHLRDDVAQDCAIRIAIVIVRDAVRDGRAPTSETHCLPAYVKTVTRGLVADRFRSLSREARIYKSYSKTLPDERPDTFCDRIECRDYLEELLTDREFHVVSKCLLEGATLREVANQTGVSHPMVAKIKHQALQKLRHYLAPEKDLSESEATSVTTPPSRDGLSIERKGQAMGTEEDMTPSNEAPQSPKIRQVCKAFDLDLELSKIEDCLPANPLEDDDEKLLDMRQTLENVAQFFDRLSEEIEDPGNDPEPSPPSTERRVTFLDDSGRGFGFVCDRPGDHGLIDLSPGGVFPEAERHFSGTYGFHGDMFSTREQDFSETLGDSLRVERQEIDQMGLRSSREE
ncbi:MAG: sigma-70 family RNA polymerase sigma factor [Planctomycetota bacterium]